MTRVLLLSVLVALPALAGEKNLGRIVSAAGADTTNASTAAPFTIPPGAKITITCTASASICAQPPQGGTGSTVCTVFGSGSANEGLPVIASEKFPTSVSTQFTSTIAGNKSATVRIVGAAAVNCTVWERSGTE